MSAATSSNNWHYYPATKVWREKCALPGRSSNKSWRDSLADEIELLGAGREFDLDAVRNGTLSPVFFGSALTNFGVEAFLEGFLRMTTAPLSRESDAGVIDAFSPDFSAFVYRIQANMNKAHRDRLAFMRICSGKFERDAEYYHVPVSYTHLDVYKRQRINAVLRRTEIPEDTKKRLVFDKLIICLLYTSSRRISGEKNRASTHSRFQRMSQGSM